MKKQRGTPRAAGAGALGLALPARAAVPDARQPGKRQVYLIDKPGAARGYCLVVHRAVSPGIGAAALITQPQSHQMAAVLGFRKILERGASMTEHTIVDKLHLPRFEGEDEDEKERTVRTVLTRTKLNGPGD